MPSPVVRLLWWAVAGVMFTAFCIGTAVLEIADHVRRRSEGSR